MTNIIRALLALLAIPTILGCALLSACAPAPAARPLEDAMRGPTYIAAALTEGRCAVLIGETSSTHFDDCILAAEDARCEREGWCD